MELRPASATNHKPNRQVRDMSPSSPSKRPTRAVAVAAAAVLPLLVWVVSVPLLGYELMVPSDDGLSEVRLRAVIVGALAAPLAGWAAIEVLERVTRHAPTVWLVGALAVLAVSFGPLLDNDMPRATALVFTIMRFTIAVALIPAMVLSTRPHRTPPSQPVDDARHDTRG